MSDQLGTPEARRIYPFYDSGWLTDYARAKAVLRVVRPDMLDAFVDALRVFLAPPDFTIKTLEGAFDDGTLEEIRRVTASLQPTDLELHEARTFGRFVVHNQPFFRELQERVVPLVSEVVGEPVQASYNFLSLYTSRGRCPLHMDSPEAKWTLDLCVGQSAPWPIYFSDIQPWPDSEDAMWTAEDWEAAIKQSLHFTPCTLQPGQAVVFSGSSQWHYRDAQTNRGSQDFWNLLFLHFIPTGTAELVQPQNWARLFAVPELSEIVSR